MIRCATIGLRNRGRALTREAQACEHIEVVALCDTDEQRLQDALQDAPGAQCYTDAAAVFANPDIDAVILALPNTLHLTLGEQALAAGKDVYMEKPLARNVAECEALIEAQNRSYKTVMVGYQQRFSKTACQARALLAQGAIGEITSATARWNRRAAAEFLWERGDWFLDPKISGGGPLIDIGVHKLDLCLDLIGYPNIDHCVAKARYGIGKRVGDKRDKNYAIEDALDAWLFTDGIDIRVESSYFRNQEQEEYHDIEITGTKGGIRLDGFGEATAWQVNDDGSITHIEVPEIKTHTALDHFADVLLGKIELRPTPEQSRDLQKIIDACYESSANGSRLIPLDAGVLV